MASAIIFVVYAFAVARVVRLITKDQITMKPRNAIINRAYRRRYGVRNADLVAHEPVPALAYLVVCPWCMSIYVGAAAAPVAWFLGRSPWTFVPALALAFSYVTGFLAGREE